MDRKTEAGAKTSNKSESAESLVPEQEAESITRAPFGFVMRERAESYFENFEQSVAGIQVFNTKGMLVDINRAGMEIFGLRSLKSARRFNLFSDPHLSSAVREKILRGENAAFEITFDFDLIKRLNLYSTTKSGQCILDCLITPQRSSRNIVTGFLMQVREVTEHRKIAQAIAQSEKRFRALIEHSTDAISLVDANTCVVYQSPSVKLLTGYSLEERLGKSGLELIHPDDLPIIKTTMARVLQQPNSIVELQFRSVRKDGTVWWTEGTAINLLNEPTVQAIVINYRDITDRKNAERALQEANEELQSRIGEIEKLQIELREQALRDPLTGLYNRRHLSDAMERELARMKRERRSMSVIVMDIDRFKKINDNFGHQVGDRFLTEIAQLIASHARSSDIACRFGGEEFLLVMPGATLKTAMKRAEAIRAQCAEIRIPTEKKQLKVTLSLGVATYPKHGKGAEEIVIKADKAMYKAKRAGRNCVQAWE